MKRALYLWLGPALVLAQSHPCAYYNIKASKLFACSTKSEFCQNYLKTDSVSLTRTTTVGKTTTTIYETTVTSTATDPNIVVTETAPTSTVYTTTTTTNNACGSPTVTSTVEEKRGLAASQPTNSACGIKPRADPSRISGACSCVLAATTTVKKTVTETIPTTTVETTIASTTTTTPLSTQTSTVCASKPFLEYMSTEGQSIVVCDDSAGSDGYLISVPPDSGATFLQLIDGTLNTNIGGVLSQVFAISLPGDASSTYGGYCHANPPDDSAAPYKCYIESVDGGNRLRCFEPNSATAEIAQAYVCVDSFEGRNLIRFSTLDLTPDCAPFDGGILLLGG